MSAEAQNIDRLEQALDSFNPVERKAALGDLAAMLQKGQVNAAPVGQEVNLHCHTIFSYNAYGYSPSKIAWLSRKRGLAVAGIVEFDVLDGTEEFLDAGRLLGLKTCVGLESRVFVPEFAELEINSPGEPGISYHMGTGFPTSRLEGPAKAFLGTLRQTAQDRTRELVGRVNRYLAPVAPDYEKDVLSLTPSGNPTERHATVAYARKAKALFPDDAKLAAFWAEKLGVTTESLKGWLPEGKDLLNLIRAKTMKKGGPGYVQPDKGSFPSLADTNAFVLAAGGIPTATWLDGTSNGEQQIERYLEVCKATGVAAINIIPDRNYKPGVKDQKLANLNHVVALAEKLGLPIVVGTEMNSPGQKFVDSFETDELKPLLPIFLRGAHIMYAHSVLQQQGGLGYVSAWAKTAFSSLAAKNEFFALLGRRLQPQQESCLQGITRNDGPDAILARIR